MAIPMNQVKSSNIDSVGYDKETAVMVVKFKNGTAYEYADVPQEKYLGMLKSDSVGSYFAQEVRNAHKASKIGDKP